MKKHNWVLLCCLIISLLGITELSANSIGPKPIVPTSLAKGTIFVAPNGKGTSCLASSPCDIWSGINKAVGGDVVFLRGGTYVFNRNIEFYKQGSAAAPIIFESYPGEIAVFDGNQLTKGTDINFLVTGKFIHIRGIEVMRMPLQGIYVTGTDNILDGVHVHHNALSGIHLLDDYNYPYPYGAYNSRNIIRNCTVHNNSAVGYYFGELANGANSDGIAISSGTDNRIENCLIYSNSDDGIDTWRSTNTYVGYSIVHSNGLGDGEGNGIKAGGDYPSADILVEHNLSYSNTGTGITFNLGRNVQLVNNTTWNNESGYYLGFDTITSNNIAAETWKTGGAGKETNNSWQRSGNVSFISTSASSPDFLVPTSNGGFNNIGAYVNVTAAKALPEVIVTVTDDASSPDVTTGAATTLPDVIATNATSSPDVTTGVAATALPDVIVTNITYVNGIFKSTIKNQGTAATPEGVVIGVAYFVNGQFKTWGDFEGPLAAGQSIEIGTGGGAYFISRGTYTISAHVDDVNRFTELIETNNELSLSKRK